MTEVMFYGGFGEIGGNIIDLETEEARILLDFGKNFGAENKYFSEFLNPRKAHASGHMSQQEIGEMVETIDPETVLAIHTENPDWFQRFATNVPTVDEGTPVRLP